MGLISRVSSRTYRYFLKTPTNLPSKWLTENPEPSFAETSHGALPKICFLPFLLSRTLLTSRSQLIERPADHEDSASSNLTPLKNAKKLCKTPKASKLMDEKLFSLKVNHEKLKVVDEVEAEVATAVETVVTKL